MPVILGIIFVLTFFLLASKLMKKLVVANIALAIFYYLGLRVLAIILGAGKGGRYSGMLSDYALPGIILMVSVPAMMTLGIVFGIAGKMFKAHSRT